MGPVGGVSGATSADRGSMVKGRSGRASAGWGNDQLIWLAQQGNQAAINALVSGAHPHVTRFAHTLCSSPQDAEDAAQEAIIILFRKIGTLRATAALASWMFRIVRNECLRLSRSTQSAQIVAWPPEREAGQIESAEERVFRRLEAERVATAIGQLPQAQLAVLIMRDIQGLSGRDTAHALGLSLPAMKSHLHRARTQMHAFLAAGQ